MQNKYNAVHDGPPDKPHLGLVVEDGEVVPIPVGANMVIIMDPNRMDGVVPLKLVQVKMKLIFTGVDFKSMTFRCNCQDPQCTRVVKFVAQWGGSHKQGSGNRAFAGPPEE